jgi:hypothetical protein
METVDKFYFTYFGGISLPFNKSREELVSINKEAIRFLINDIKLYKDMAIQDHGFGSVVEYRRRGINRRIVRAQLRYYG